MKKLTFDFETRSMCDLKKVGAYKYSLDPTTQPTCLAFKVLGKPTVYFLDFEMVNKKWVDLPSKLQTLWQDFLDNDYLFTAHNAFFERCIYENILHKRYGWPYIPPKRYRCTAAKAAACALPRNLEGAGEALNLSIQKDKSGYNAMMATCKPTKQWTAWKKACDDVFACRPVGPRKRHLASQPEPPIFATPESHPEVFRVLYHYCKIDVRTEELLDQALPDLIRVEQEIWHLNQELNWRGLRVDSKKVDKISWIMEIEVKKKLKRLGNITMGIITKAGARNAILEYLSIEGVHLPDLRSKTIEDKLKEELENDPRELLEIRQALCKSSNKKYLGFKNRCVEYDERIRDLLLYHGASTGRDTGVGIQPHNFPRNLIPQDSIEMTLDILKQDVAPAYEELKFFFGDSLAVAFSSLLRSMIIPSKGYELFVADFSKIEVAVLWWLAENEEGIKVLISGLDPYIYMAVANTRRFYGEIEKAIINNEQWAIDARQLAKAQILGCGFSMGADKFRKTAWDQYRLKLTLAQSKEAVKNYRETYWSVPQLWKNYERAAILAVKNKGRIFLEGKCAFFVKKSFLWVELPSGRRLAYKDPSIAWRVREWEETIVSEVEGKEVEQKIKRFTDPLETLEFMAVNSRTKKWNLERTFGGSLCENIVQAVARDLMMHAALRLEKSGYRMLLTVHDEALTEKPIGEGSMDEFISIMTARPSWADQHLPIEAKGWVGTRYRK